MTGWCKTPEDFLEVAGLDGIDPEIADRRQVEWIAQLHGEGEAV